MHMGMDFKDSAVFTAAFQKLLIGVRRHSFVTQTELSKSAGLTRQSISMMESGKRVASFQTFCILAQGLGISPVELMYRFVRICEAEAFARQRRPDHLQAAQLRYNARFGHQFIL